MLHPPTVDTTEIQHWIQTDDDNDHHHDYNNDDSEDDSNDNDNKTHL